MRISKAVFLLALSGSVFAQEAHPEILPLPGEAFRDKEPGDNPITDLTHRFVGTTGEFKFELPDSMLIENQGGEIIYDNDKKTIRYVGKGQKIRLRGEGGLDVEAESITADLESSRATMAGAISVYQGEMLSRAKNGSYNWKDKTLTAEDFKSKAHGLIIHGDYVEYAQDKDGRPFVSIRGARVSTDDVEDPSVWIKASELKVYPGDTGKISGMGIDWGVVHTPGLGITLSHSLNPEEGYLPIPGSRGIWGTYLLNRYGFLIGNRHVEGGMPVADYIVTTKLDLRARRGVAVGLEAKDCRMEKTFDMPGLDLYYIADEAPHTNPTYIPRHDVKPDRFRIAMQSMWELKAPAWDRQSHWTAQTNVNVVGDEYVLRDFFSDLSETDDKPDNTMRLERRTDKDLTLLWTRFAPNDFYSTDQRAELTYYRVRSTIGETGIAYETRNGFGLFRQYVPEEQRMEFREKLAQLTDPSQREYYTRMLNTGTYFRANSSHELTTSFKLFNAINITPKVGAGYSGYYGVDDIGADNRFLGYAGCNFDVKFHRRFENVTLPWMGGRGLMHVVRPYVNVSYCKVSSSNQLVPKVDVWSTTLSNSSSTPMELDLMGFTNIDSWGTWAICRMGVSNNFTTYIEGDPHTLLSWNCFVDYNAENPNTQNNFSNLFTTVTFRPSPHYAFSLQAQVPMVNAGDGFRQCNTGFTVQPCSWFESTLGHSYITGHPLIRDASQVYIRSTIRLNEKMTIAGRIDWDIKTKRIPIQQYGVFHKWGPWYVGATVFLRDNGGKKETGFGISFTLTETGTGLPIEFF